jgi:pilus assembly protein CpaF
MMEIMECEILADGSRHYRALYQYIITENRMDDDGKFIIEGTHKQECKISGSLAKRLLENGMPIEMINRMKRREEF